MTECPVIELWTFVIKNATNIDASVKVFSSSDLFVSTACCEKLIRFDKIPINFTALHLTRVHCATFTRVHCATNNTRMLIVTHFTQCDILVLFNSWRNALWQKSTVVHSGQVQCIRTPFHAFFLTLDYVPARSLRSLRSKISYQLSVCEILFPFVHGG